MTETLIVFETAKLAKDKAFQERTWDAFVIDTKEGICNTFTFGHNTFPNRLARPTQTILQKWLRDTHKVIVEVYVEKSDLHSYQYAFRIYFNEQSIYKSEFKAYSRYEEALEVGLYEALKRIP